MKHLILGSSGQVGVHLVEYLKNIKEEIIIFDIVDDSSQDLRKPGAIDEYIAQADFVYFLAFDIGGSKYLEKYQDTFDFIDNNMKIMSNTFNSIKKYNKPFIFASSQMSNMSYSTYGILKSIGERYTKSLGGLNVYFWNVYGYEENEEKAHVITDFVKMALQEGNIKMRTTGIEQRQFLYGNDCAECLYRLATLCGEINREVPLHITSFKWESIWDIANIIKEQIGCNVVAGIKEDTVQKDKRNEPNSYILNFWEPKTSLKEGIKEIIKYEQDKYNRSR
jgi:nucleoside-diphosphate-sugar epimerase